MKIRPFKLERYFAKYEFSSKYLLSSSDCDGLAQAEVLSWADSETRRLWDDLKLGYTESPGLPLLRQEIAKLYQGISAENILIATPEEGVFIALNVLLNKGDHVICTWPGYQSLYELAVSLECEFDKWRPDEGDGWRFDPDALTAMIRPNTSAIICNFPHNPTGYLPSNEDFQKLIEVAKRHDLYLFSDEMYRLLELNRDDRLPSAAEVYDKAVSLFGMSKAFGMAGVRIGWLATGNGGLYTELARFKDYTTICSSAPSEILSLIALRAKDAIIARHLARMERNLTVLGEFFDRHRGLFCWTRPSAGTIGFPRILSDEGASSFCERVVRETGIMLLPSTIYDYGDRHLRLGFGRENMPEAMEVLERYLGSWKRHVY